MLLPDFCLQDSAVMVNPPVAALFTGVFFLASSIALSEEIDDRPNTGLGFATKLGPVSPRFGIAYLQVD